MNHTEAKVLPLLLGEGNEEIANMIQNYIKEIEELRYGVTAFFISSYLNALVLFDKQSY